MTVVPSVTYPINILSVALINNLNFSCQSLIFISDNPSKRGLDLYLPLITSYCCLNNSQNHAIVLMSLVLLVHYSVIVFNYLRWNLTIYIVVFKVMFVLLSIKSPLSSFRETKVLTIHPLSWHKLSHFNFCEACKFWWTFILILKQVLQNYLLRQWWSIPWTAPPYDI